MLFLITGLSNPIPIPTASIIRPTFLYGAAVYAPILGMSFFVVLPLILRESAKRTISADHDQLSYQAINSILQKKFKREKVLSGLLWFGLLFCPFLLGLVISGWSNQISLLSVFYIMYIPGYPTFFGAMFYGVPLELICSSVTILPIMALLSSVRFTFVRDVFRFQDGIINKSRLVSDAILGEILPAAMITSLMLITTSPSLTSLLLFPTPVLPIIGFTHIKLSRTKHLKEELWPDYESRMWYEQKQEPHATESAEESIKVPLTYLLISQVRKFRSKET